MSDDFNQVAIECHADALVDQAREDPDFAAAVLLAAARMLAASGTLHDVTTAIKTFAGVAMDCCSDALAGTSAADALLDRVRRAEGSTDV